MFSNKKNTHIKEGASAAHDLMETEAAGSSSGAVITNKKKASCMGYLPNSGRCRPPGMDSFSFRRRKDGRISGNSAQCGKS